MKHCENCNVEVNTDKPYCPLCYSELDGDNCNNLIYKTKDKAEKYRKNDNLLAKIFLYITICSIALCFFINFSTDKNTLWSLIVASSVIYVWILVRHTIISRRNIFEKILFQFVGICLVLFFTNLISGGGDWFWNYIVPSVSLVTTTVTLILCFSFASRGHLASFFLLFVLMLIFALILILTGLDAFMILNQIVIIFNVLIILGILIFRFKDLKRSIYRIFNI